MSRTDFVLYDGPIDSPFVGRKELGDEVEELRGWLAKGDAAFTERALRQLRDIIARGERRLRRGDFCEER